MAMSDTEPIGAFIIVRNDKGEVLLGKRKNGYKHGVYGCPGGRLDKEESLEACAKRELFEETSLKAITLTYLGVVREWQDKHNFIHFAFVCDDYQGMLENAEPDKCEGWEYSSLDNLPKLILPAHSAALKLLKGNVVNLVDI
jgi:8-oxo-dGTP diphosphatase